MPATTAQSVFDMPHYRRLIESRERFLRRVVPALQRDLSLRTALDAGCGVGFFASLLNEMGLQVAAFDGRMGNVEEARSRYPGLQFLQADVEDSHVTDLGSFDLVLCFGLLYHLENPFRAIRNLQALTARVLLVESMTIPDERAVLSFREEGSTEDQGLRHMAFYPSEACLVKMFYRAGFSTVYGFTELPDHADFCAARERRRIRSLLLAARVPVRSPFVAEIREPSTEPDPWVTGWTPLQSRIDRVAAFLRKPLPEKWAAIRRRLGKENL